jgi:hypothetical protein
LTGLEGRSARQLTTGVGESVGDGGAGADAGTLAGGGAGAGAGAVLDATGGTVSTGLAGALGAGGAVSVGGGAAGGVGDGEGTWLPAALGDGVTEGVGLSIDVGTALPDVGGPAEDETGKPGLVGGQNPGGVPAGTELADGAVTVSGTVWVTGISSELKNGRAGASLGIGTGGAGTPELERSGTAPVVCGSGCGLLPTATGSTRSTSQGFVYMTDTWATSPVAFVCTM